MRVITIYGYVPDRSCGGHAADEYCASCDGYSGAPDTSEEEEENDRTPSRVPYATQEHLRRALATLRWLSLAALTHPSIARAASELRWDDVPPAVRGDTE